MSDKAISRSQKQFEDNVCLSCCMLGTCKIQEPTDSSSWTKCAHFREQDDLEEARRVLSLERQNRLNWIQKPIVMWDGETKIVSLLPVISENKKGYLARNREFVSDTDGVLRFTGQFLE